MRIIPANPMLPVVSKSCVRPDLRALSTTRVVRIITGRGFLPVVAARGRCPWSLPGGRCPVVAARGRCPWSLPVVAARGRCPWSLPGGRCPVVAARWSLF